MLKVGQEKRVLSYRGHQVWLSRPNEDLILWGYAKKKDGTDDWFESWEECQKDIDELEDNK